MKSNWLVEVNGKKEILVFDSNLNADEGYEKAELTLLEGVQLPPRFKGLYLMDIGKLWFVLNGTSLFPHLYKYEGWWAV